MSSPKLIKVITTTTVSVTIRNKERVLNVLTVQEAGSLNVSTFCEITDFAETYPQYAIVESTIKYANMPMIDKWCTSSSKVFNEGHIIKTCKK